MTACSVRLSPPTAGAVDVDVNHGCQRLPAFTPRRDFAAVDDHMSTIDHSPTIVLSSDVATPISPENAAAVRAAPSVATDSGHGEAAASRRARKSRVLHAEI